MVSDDLGETWSEEFVIRGDAYTWDLGYEVFTEAAGRADLHRVLDYVTQESEEPVPESACVRYIAGTFFRLE